MVRQLIKGRRIKDKISERKSSSYRKVVIPLDATCVGRKLRNLQLPPDCIIVSLRRVDQVIVPHDDTILIAGDVVEIFGLEEELNEVEVDLSLEKNL